jgi:putative hydrolase of the HAD superfamily
MGFMVTGCLVDVYETILTCDFPSVWRERAEVAGVELRVWQDAWSRIGPTTGVGQMSMAEAIAVCLRTCGVTPRDELVRDLVRMDRELLLAASRLYPDAMPFLELLKARGIKIAIVSNCSQHTRDLLISLGVADIADSLVLSFEVGCIKPAPRIYRHALEQLGVAASDAVFVDDQAAFCAGSEAVGVRGVQIARRGTEPIWPSATVSSLLDVEALLEGVAD